MVNEFGCYTTNPMNIGGRKAKKFRVITVIVQIYDNEKLPNISRLSSTLLFWYERYQYPTRRQLIHNELNITY